MAMLEASLRKLVREEATSAASETATACSDEYANAVRAGTAEAVRLAMNAIGVARRVNWSPDLRDDLVAGTPVDFNHVGDRGVAELRAKAVELAVVSRQPTDTAESIVAAAAFFAAFMLDGVPSFTKPRDA